MKTYYHYILIFFLIPFILIYSKTPKLKFEKVSIDQGLSQSIIITIFQDNKGFLWVGTQEGLNKYDGYEFIHYKNNPNDNTTISDNYVKKIIEDSDKNLWIATSGGGLNKFYAADNKFISFQHDENNPASLSDNNITTMVKDSSGNLWIGTYYNGLEFFDTHSKKFIHYKNDPTKQNSLIDNYVTALFYDISGEYLWVGTYGGLNLLDISSGEFINLNNYVFKNPSIENYWIRDIHIDKEQNIWIATDAEGLFKINNFTSCKNLSSTEIKNFKHNPNIKESISGNSINSICETSSGDIYLGVWDGGLNRIVQNKQNGNISFQSWLKNPGEPGSITENDLTFVMEDHSGVVWIGTYGDGLNKLTPHSLNFTHYKYNPYTKNSLTDNQVTAVLEDENNNLWIGTWNGLNKLDKKKNIYTHLKSSHELQNSISGNRITSILQDSKGTLWIGTLNSGLNRYSPVTGKFTKFQCQAAGPNGIPSNRILSLLEATDGRIWIGSYFSGVIVYDPVKNSFSTIDVSHFEEFDKRVNKVLEDPDGNILIGTYKGIYKHYVKRNFTEAINIKNELKQDILTNGVLDINQDKQGNLWVGSFGSGIYKLTYIPEENAYQAKVFDTRHGLPNNYAHALQFDKEQNLWISTRKGLAKFNPVNETFEIFTAYEGVDFYEFCSGSFFNNNNDHLYFCSMHGLLELSPGDIEVRYSEPQIVITQLKIFNKPVNLNIQQNLAGLNNSEYISLNYNENSISLEFAALDFIAPQSTKYKYKLEGFDKEFITAEQGNRTATYTNLPSGEYIFKIKAYLGANLKTGYQKEIHITVVPPFWEKAWFRVFVIILLLFTLYAIYSIRTVAIRKRNEELQKEVKLRTKELEGINAAKDKFFSIIAHDLKAPFSYLLSNSEFLAKEAHNITQNETESLAANINIATSNIYNLLENLLQWSKYQMMGLKLEPQKIDLTQVVINNISFVKSHAVQKKIKIEQTIQPEIEIYSDENIINTILRNLLMNAIKFTKENGNIYVKTVRENGNVKVSISDTGIGINQKQIDEILSSTPVVSAQGTKNEKGTVLGLFLIKEFIETMNGQLKIESTKNKGTVVTCIIPAE